MPKPTRHRLGRGLCRCSYRAALLATYAMLFARPATLLRRVLAWLSYASASVAALYGVAYIVGVWTSTADPNQPWFSGLIPQLASGALCYLFPLLCLLVTISQTRGAERARIAWASASLGLFYIYWVAWGALPALDPSLASRTLLYIGNVIGFICPLGLTYSLLSRRLLDIGFVINRAAVFSSVSLIILGVFVLGEWMLGEWFSTASHTTNLAISAALVLGLGLSVRAIHSRVDHILDNVFFRKRHEDEQAIRGLAREATYITDADTLVHRTKEMLEARVGASFVNVTMEDGAGGYGAVDPNDPAVVALRAQRKALDLHTIQTEIRGELAYPMVARGRLVGVLVVGPKRSDETYAPDESDAIAQLALSVGAALDMLSVKHEAHHEPQNDAILKAIAALSSEVRALRDATRSLHEAMDRTPQVTDVLDSKYI